MLEAGESFLERLDQEQGIIKLLNIENSLHSNTNRLIDIYKSQGLLEEATASKSELECIRERIKNLEKSKLESDEMNRFVAKIQEEKNYIDKEMRPKFIRYCKVYINIKKDHAKDMRTVGYIKYNKADEKKKILKVSWFIYYDTNMYSKSMKKDDAVLSFNYTSTCERLFNLFASIPDGLRRLFSMRLNTAMK